MASQEASILLFQFDDFMDSCCSSRCPRDVLAASAATDERRLLLRKDNIPPGYSKKKKNLKKEDDRVVISIVLVKEKSRSRSNKYEIRMERWLMKRHFFSSNAKM